MIKTWEYWATHQYLEVQQVTFTLEKRQIIFERICLDIGPAPVLCHRQIGRVPPAMNSWGFTALLRPSNQPASSLLDPVAPVSLGPLHAMPTPQRPLSSSINMCKRNLTHLLDGSHTCRLLLVCFEGCHESNWIHNTFEWCQQFDPWSRIHETSCKHQYFAFSK